VPTRPADTPISTPLRWVGFRRSALQQGSRSQSQGFELALTPAVFGLIGYGIDRLLGTVPAVTIVLAVFAFVGVAVRMWFGYDAQMKVEQERYRVRKAELDALEAVSTEAKRVAAAAEAAQVQALLESTSGTNGPLVLREQSAS
jgi:Putative F0F1-ATPase subunit Ca2+/Mg2+ transporter